MELLTKEARLSLDEFLRSLAITEYTLQETPATSVGNNFAGIIVRVTVTIDSSKKLSLIVKRAPDSTLIRSICPLRAMYEKETYYYEKVLPQLKNLQEEVNVLERFKAYPKLHQASLMELNEILIFDDMNTLGFRQRDRREPLDYEHSVFVIREYAKLHGVGYALKQMKPKVFEELSKNARDVYFQNIKLSELKQKNLNQTANRALATLDAVEHREAYERFAKFSKSMFGMVRNALKSESAGEYAVFTHSDCWMGNYLFKYQDGALADLCMLDWQLACSGSPALDLSYFFYCCTDQQLRRKHFKELVQEYYNTLCLFLQQFRCDVKQVLPFDVLQEHLRRFAVYGLYMATIVLNVTLVQGETCPSMQHSIDEADLLRLRNPKDDDDLQLYKSRMSGVILDFIGNNCDLI